MKFSFKFFLLVVCFSVLSCRINNDTSGVPLVSVNLTIYTSDPAFFNLNPIGGWEYVSGGSRGVLIYRLGTNEFVAFDRHCTYDPGASCAKISVNSSNVIAIDTCCGSEFLITDGSVMEGPASYGLKQYQTTFDGDVLRVFN
jgi:nitrite reductase/ring-hydroxylating ferredoxin subunit